MTNDRPKKFKGALVIGAILGGLLGGVVALLLTPYKGREARKKLKEKGKKFFDEAEIELKKINKEKVQPFLSDVEKKSKEYAKDIQKEIDVKIKEVKKKKKS